MGAELPLKSTCPKTPIIIFFIQDFRVTVLFVKNSSVFRLLTLKLKLLTLMTGFQDEDETPHSYELPTQGPMNSDPSPW